jgi:hypothetical protein
LAISFINALEDYARSKYPRARAPQWLRRMGDLWLQVWQRLCLKRDPVETIAGALGQADPDRAEEIRRACVQIKARVPNCGIVVAETTTEADPSPSAPDTPHDAMADDELALVLVNVGTALHGRDASAAPSAGALNRLREALQLDDVDRLLLKLMYDDGHNVAAAARILKLTRKQASRRHLAVLARLRKVLAPLGLGDPS